MVGLLSVPVVGDLLTPDPLGGIRSAIRESVVRKLSGNADPAETYGAPGGDRGWFGPGSVTWRVHGDLPAMLTGGMASLLLQTLHPRATAGVSDHSDFRADPLGRLQRTAHFVGTTTFASSEEAERAVRTVRAVHGRVKGTTPAGEAYAAQDPELLTWVHVAEVSSFLASYQRYTLTPLSARQVDRYYDEVAVVAEKLGAGDVPRSAPAVRRYFHSVRPQLSFGDQAAEAIAFLLAPRGVGPLERSANDLIMQAAIGLVPSWARDLAGLSRPDVVDSVLVRPSAFALAGILRWALGPSEVLRIARDRAAGRPISVTLPPGLPPRLT